MAHWTKSGANLEGFFSFSVSLFDLLTSVGTKELCSVPNIWWHRSAITWIFFILTQILQEITASKPLDLQTTTFVPSNPSTLCQFHLESCMNRIFNQPWSAAFQAGSFQYNIHHSLCSIESLRQCPRISLFVL